jgi:hypothetical protein
MGFFHRCGKRQCDKNATIVTGILPIIPFLQHPMIFVHFVVKISYCAPAMKHKYYLNLYANLNSVFAMLIQHV